MTEPRFSWPALRRATPARIGLGRAGAGLPTRAHLDFQLAHALARDAVCAALDAERIAAELHGLGLEPIFLRSAATDRPTYLRRPDLGRRLEDASRQLLSRRAARPVELALVIADGLSANAVNTHAVPLVRALLQAFGDDLPRLGPAAVVEGGRVAIGDEIGGLLGADLVAVLIGERPGVSAADSLGVYATWQPAAGTLDAARNCLSNIRPGGMPVAEAAEALRRLIVSARRHRMTGVGLSQRLGSGALQAPAGHDPRTASGA
jgi:ethanolamine ammonia-lyase small subunit